MKGQKKEPDNVKRGDVYILKPVNHHGVNIIPVQRISFKKRKPGIEIMPGEMQQVEDNECQHNQAAYYHVTGCPGRLDVFLSLVAVGARTAIFQRQQDREVDVQNNSD